eukprot:366490-Chlamydomonas_euryale.AAC.5
MHGAGGQAKESADVTAQHKTKYRLSPNRLQGNRARPASMWHSGLEPGAAGLNLVVLSSQQRDMHSSSFSAASPKQQVHCTRLQRQAISVHHRIQQRLTRRFRPARHAPGTHSASGRRLTGAATGAGGKGSQNGPASAQCTLHDACADFHPRNIRIPQPRHACIMLPHLMQRVRRCENQHHSVALPPFFAVRS